MCNKHKTIIQKLLATRSHFELQGWPLDLTSEQGGQANMLFKQLETKWCVHNNSTVQPC
jgi:hypothetical protein